MAHYQVYENLWLSLFLAARNGESERVVAQINSLERQGRIGWRAVAARALLVLRRTVEAQRMIQRALLDGGDDAAALATFTSQWGEACALKRLQDAPSEGHRADAACDLALLALRRTNMVRAREMIAQALTICPHHAEAGHWLRFLDTDCPATQVRHYLMLSGEGKELRGGDVCSLVSSRSEGWVSRERLRRRYLSPQPQGDRSALSLLAARGIEPQYFLTVPDACSASADDPRVALETDADLFVALLDEQRDPRRLADQLWEGVQSDRQRTIAAELILAGATRQKALKDFAKAVADHMVVQAPGELRWHVWRAWLKGGSKDVAHAAIREQDSTLFQLALEILRQQGLRLNGLVAPWLDCPVRGHIARHYLNIRPGEHMPPVLPTPTEALPMSVALVSARVL